MRGGSRRSPGLSPWQPPLALISRRCLQAQERALDTCSGFAAGKSSVKVLWRALQGRHPSQGTLGRSQTARGGFSATPSISAASMCAKRSPLRAQRCAARRQRLCVRRPVRPRTWQMLRAQEDVRVYAELQSKQRAAYGRRRRGGLGQKSATETDKMPQLRFWARSPMRCQALDTARSSLLSVTGRSREVASTAPLRVSPLEGGSFSGHL